MRLLKTDLVLKTLLVFSISLSGCGKFTKPNPPVIDIEYGVAGQVPEITQRMDWACGDKSKYILIRK
jgi:hypothetical protein